MLGFAVEETNLHGFDEPMGAKNAVAVIMGSTQPTCSLVGRVSRAKKGGAKRLRQLSDRSYFHRWVVEDYRTLAYALITVK